MLCFHGRSRVVLCVALVHGFVVQMWRLTIHLFPSVHWALKVNDVEEEEPGHSACVPFVDYRTFFRRTNFRIDVFYQNKSTKPNQTKPNWYLIT